MRPTPAPPLFPYTTLFRSTAATARGARDRPPASPSSSREWTTSRRRGGWPIARSEEHTSELQSRPHLVCRLLLEKKKKHHPTEPRDANHPRSIQTTHNGL